MGISNNNILFGTLNTDCGILPVYLTVIDLASMHVRLMTVNLTQPVAQIHSNLINHSLLHSNTYGVYPPHRHLNITSRCSQSTTTSQPQSHPVLPFFGFWIHTVRRPSTTGTHTDGGAVIIIVIVPRKRLVRRHSRNGPWT